MREGERPIPQNTDNGWEGITNIQKTGGSEEQRLIAWYRAQGKEARFVVARDQEGHIILDHWTLEVRDKIEKVLDTGIADLLKQLPKIDKNKLVESYDDPKAEFYRGTILGLILVAMARDGGMLRSFDPDREDVKPMQTTVVSTRIETAECYAREHGTSTATESHDSIAIATQLGIDPAQLQEHPSLLYPVVLHIQGIATSENPKYANEFHTNYPVNLLHHLTPECKTRIEAALGISLEKIS